MADKERKCSECGGAMEEGFILDKSYGASLISRWLKGHPESGWQGAKTKGKECRSIETWRCVECGLLKSYAIEEVDPPGIFNP